MIQIKYLDGNTERVRMEVEVSEKAMYRKELMTEEYVRLTFNTLSLVNLAKGDYIDTEFGRFYLVHIEKPERNVGSDGGWSYDQKFHAGWERWSTRMLFYSRQRGSEKAWSMTQRPEYFLQIVIDNLYAAGFGRYIADIDAALSEMKLVQFDGDNIIGGLNKIAEAWETEWWISDNIIHLGKCEFGTPLRFEIGGLINKMTRSEGQANDYITRLYAFGSTRNIPTNYRKSEDSSAVIESVVERRLKLPEGIDHIDAWVGLKDEDVVEGVAIFDEIYPRRIGTIDTISTVQYKDKITDDDNPDGYYKEWNAYRFTDTGITFSKDYILPDVELHIIFQSGSLAGMDFAVAFNPEGVPEDKAEAQQWEIIRNDNYGIDLPAEDFHPKKGDTYVLYGYDTRMVSDILIPAAEQELLTEAKKLLAKKCVDNGVYTCDTDPIRCAGYTENSGELIYHLSDEIDLDVGQRIELKDDNYFSASQGVRQSRVRAFEKHLDNKFNCSYEVGETASYSHSAETDAQVQSLTIQNTQILAMGGNVYLIKRYDTTTPSSNNAYSAARANVEFLHRNRIDTAEAKIKFLEGIETGDYIEGQKGAAVDGEGRAEVESLKVRGCMEVMELVYNRLNAIEGNTEFSESGSIAAVEHVGGLVYRLTMRRRWEGDFTAFHADDIIYGYVNRLDDSGTFYKVWAWVQSVDRDANTLQVCMYHGADVPGGVNGLFGPGMTVSRRGNRTDRERQRSFCISTTDGNIVELTGVDRPVVTRANYGMVLGRLPEGLVPESVSEHMIGGLPYLYARGIIVQDILRMDYQGNIAQEKPLTVWGIRNAAVVNMNVATPLTTVVVERTRGGEFVQITDQLMLEADGVHLEISIDDGDWRLYFLGETSPLMTEDGETLTTESGESLTGGDARLPFAEMRRSIDLRLVDVDGTVLAESRAVAVYDGSDGLDGKDGLKGKDGVNGKDGIDGLPGEKGDKGDKGDPGKDGTDGKDGADGARGAILRGPQDWESLPSGYAFQAGGKGEEFKDFVVYKGEYYSCTASHVKTTLTPVDGSATTPKLWQLSDRIEMVATQILLAKYALVKNLGVERVQTVGDKASIDIHDGMIEIFGQYCCNIRFGVDDDGYAVLEYYDNNGKFLYDLGPKGIRQIEKTNSRWEELRLLRTHDAGKTAEEVRKAFTSGAALIDMSKYGIYYRFHAGSTAGVYDPVEKRFDSKVFCSKSLEISNYIPDGWYMIYNRDPTMADTSFDDSIIGSNPNFGKQEMVTEMQFVNGICQNTIIIYKPTQI